MNPQLTQKLARRELPVVLKVDPYCGDAQQKKPLLGPYKVVRFKPLSCRVEPQKVRALAAGLA